MNPADLQDLVHRELKALPTPRAPRTLLPRVLAATVHRASAPWYARGWTHWSLGWQVASSLVFLAVAAGIFFAVPLLERTASAWFSPTASPMEARLAIAIEAFQIASVLVRGIWEVWLEPVGTLLLVVAVALSLGCAVLWTALNRVALGGAAHQ